MSNEWMLVRDVAKLKGVTESAVRHAIRIGRIEAVRVGTTYALLDSEVQYYMQMKRRGRKKNGNHSAMKGEPIMVRDGKERVPELAPRTGGESSAVPGVSDAPGDGAVTTPINRDRQPGNRAARNAALEGDKMQRLVGGGEIREHEYRDDPTPPDAEEDRRE